MPTNHPITIPNARTTTVRAFSLVELITVVAILAVLAGVAIPRFAASADHAATRSAAAATAEHIHTAARHAVAAGATRMILIEPDALRLTTHSRDDAGKAVLDATLLLAPPPFGLDRIATGTPTRVRGTDGLVRFEETIRARGVALTVSPWGDFDTTLTVRLGRGQSVAEVAIDAATNEVTTP